MIQTNIKSEQGLTKQREAVLQVVRESENHLTANEVFEYARQILPTISFATVYNSLRFLTESELITEISFGNGASRFDKTTSRHDHALCVSCGKLVDIDIGVSPQLVNRAASLSGFKPESLQMTLRGFCSECQINNKK